MSHIRKAFFGAVAITLTLGAVQLAFGHDLAGRWQAISDTPGQIVNRAGKADRIAGLTPSEIPTLTVSMRLNDLAATSVLLRVPMAAQTGNAKPPALLRTQNRKPAIACESVVSSLTEVARLLQPGRCVT